MLPDPKKRKIGSKTSDCMFIGYAEHNAAYRFLVLKSDMIECDTIMETKNAEFSEDIFALRSRASSSLERLVETYNEPISDDLRRSKRHRIKKSFGDDFYTYLTKDDPLNFSEAISSSD